MSILITILALGIVIFIHELGHMLFAKRSGVGVSEFAVGMGPKIISRQFGETTYSLRLMPLGGYVKLAGLDDEEDCPPEQNYHNKPISARFLTIAGGALMNIILGYVIYTVVVMSFGIPTATNTIAKVMPESPAYSAGLLAGDKILEVDGVAAAETQKLIQIINKSPEKQVVLTVQRADQEVQVPVIPELKGKIGLIGVQFVSETTFKKEQLYKAFYYGGVQTLQSIKLVFKSLGMLFSGSVNAKDMAGPLGIIQFASFSLQQGFLQFLTIMAMISISLGVINLFPFPVLDGGHLVLLLIEAVRKKRLARKWEMVINNAGAVVLITLMITVIANDVFRWSERVNILNQLP